MLNGKPAVVVALTCDAGGTGLFYNLNVDNANLDILHQQERYSEGLVWTNMSSSPLILDLEVEGPSPSYQTQAMPIYGKNGGSENVNATVELTWDGTKYMTNKILYHTDQGPVGAPKYGAVTRNLH